MDKQKNRGIFGPGSFVSEFQNFLNPVVAPDIPPMNGAMTRLPELLISKFQHQRSLLNTNPGDACGGSSPNAEVVF